MMAEPEHRIPSSTTTSIGAPLRAPAPLTPSEIVLVRGREFADRQRPIGLSILLIAGIIGCSFISYRGLTEVHDAWSSSSWPSTHGTITSSKVATTSDDSNTLFKADIRYRYEVEGRAYDGATVWFGGGYSSSDEDAARKVVDSYPQGMSVHVTYEPDHPEKAVLEPGMYVSSFVIFFAGLLAAFVLLVALITQIPLLIQR